MFRVLINFRVLKTISLRWRWRPNNNMLLKSLYERLHNVSLKQNIIRLEGLLAPTTLFSIELMKIPSY